MNIPFHEQNFIINDITIKKHLLIPSEVQDIYRDSGIQNIFPSPLSNEITDIIIEAILKKKPLSVIRIGDGEANLLSYGAYPETPILNLQSAKKIISKQHDRFNPDTLQIVKLQHMLFESLLTADVIGVLGLWRPQRRSANDFIQAFKLDMRGISGHWRGIDLLLRYVTSGFFVEKTFTSAHIYISVLKNLKNIILAAQNVILITNRSKSFHILRNQYSNINISQISVGMASSTNSTSRLTPDFLLSVKKQLPDVMNGTLCLVGSGPWSEIYCHWIKMRGGIAIDIGSAFDLIEGIHSRPVHKFLKNLT